MSANRSRGSCRSGKRRFPDRLAAMIALVDIGASDAPARQEQRAYRCNDCRGWHLTSKALYESPRMSPWEPSRKRKYNPPRLDKP